MSHQIKINLGNENSSSQTLQPIIISWTNPSTDNQSQIDDTRIKHEDELQIISQVIREVPHPATRKSAEIISPTRVLRSHGKVVDKSPEVVVKKVSLRAKGGSKTQNDEIITKVADLTSKTMDADKSSPWVTTVVKKSAFKSKNQAKSTKIQDIESNSNKKLTKKLAKILPKEENSEKAENSIKVPKKRQNLKSVAKSNNGLKIGEKVAKIPETKALKRDKNGNSLKLTNGPKLAARSPPSSPIDPKFTSIEGSFIEDYIKKEKELNIESEVDARSQNSTNVFKTDQNSKDSENTDSKVGKITVKNLKTLQKSIQSPTIPQHITKLAIKDEVTEEVTITVTNITPISDVKLEPKDTSSESSPSTSQTATSPLKYFKVENNHSSSLNPQQNIKFTAGQSLDAQVTANSKILVPSSSQNSSSSEKVNIQTFELEPKLPEPTKYDSNNDDSSDDDEDRLIIKEEEDIETIDISDSDDEQPAATTTNNHQNSWNNLNLNPDSNSISSQVSISYPSVDGSSSLQPPVIQVSYQFPMDSQNSASSTQIQKHFMLSGLESSSHKYLGQQSTFGQLFGTTSRQNSQSQVDLDESLRQLNAQALGSHSSQAIKPQSSKKRSNSSLMTPSSSKISENPSKKQKLLADPHQTPIIPYMPATIPPRRISSTSSDGSSSTSHPFQCKMCLAIFKRKIDMIHHLKSHSEAKYECQRCGMKFKFEGYFQKHECIACDLCNKTFFLKQQLRNHRRNEHDIQMEMYECDLCGKKLRYRHGVLYHMSKTHMKYLEDKYQCDVCGKRFKLKESIRLHIKNHESVIECSLCDKKVKRINLNVHMKSVHVTERNFKCRICKTSFKTKECLKSHIRTHEKSFECTECGKRFSNKSHLKEHVEWHRNPEAYKCKICQKSFAQKYCLKAHVKLHESGHLFTKFKCSLCPYSTDKAENLEKHELKHKRQEENTQMRKNWLQCEKCPVKLKNKLKLATHYWKKHSEVMPK